MFVLVAGTPAGPLRRGPTLEAAPDGPGAFYRPTLLAGVAQDSEVVREEVFGPVLCVLAFGDDDSHELMVTSCNSVVDAIEARDREVARRTAEQRVADATARLIDYHLNQEP